MSRRGIWSTRYGFYMAAIGAAFSLGNLWRFPYVVANNGGGAFVVLYVFCALLVGLPLLVAELGLGRTTRRSVVSAMDDVAGRFGRTWGYLCVGTGIAVLSYYAVISGWVLHFLTLFFWAWISPSYSVGPEAISKLRDSGVLQVGLTSAHLLVVSVIVAKGVRDGIERWVSYLIPLFLILMVTLLVQVFSLPTATEALRFLFYPDFSKINPSSALQALGHVLFTLSIGFGVMVTFGSYLQEDVHVPTAGFRVTMINLGVSLVAGFLIFSFAFQTGAGGDPNPELMFQTVPLFLSRHKIGPIMGAAFFLCLYMGSLVGSIGLLEAATSGVVDRWHVRRSWASGFVGLGVFILAMIPAMSSNLLQDVHIFGKTILVAVDTVLIAGVLPILSLGMGLLVITKIPKDRLKEIFVNPRLPSSVLLYPKWRKTLKVGIPITITAAFAAAFLKIFF